jgi:FKBP-type peptidyl-prolyl cis-trans isomerase FklB
MDSLSYGLGILLGQNLKQLEIENIDAATLSMAIDDLLKGRDLKMTPEQANMLVSNQMAAAAGKPDRYRRRT